MDLEEAIKDYLSAAAVGILAILALPIGLVLLPFAAIGCGIRSLVIYIEDKLDGTETVRT